MEVVQSTIIKLSDIEVNKGQIPGLPGNPRFIRDEKYKKLIKSLQDNPEMTALRELLVFEHGGKYVIIGGNMRYRAMKELGYKETICKIIPAGTPVEALKAYTIKDNAGFGEWDFEQLANDWDLDQIESWGVDIPDVDLDPEPEEAEEDNFDVESNMPKNPVSKIGDIYRLGRHRLVCGDATIAEHLDALMDGKSANAYITDPPYNVDYVGKTKDALKIDNDKMADATFQEFLFDSFTQADRVMKKGASYYIWHSDSEGYNFRTAALRVGWKLRQTLIWSKNTMVLGRQDYQWKHEPCQLPGTSVVMEGGQTKPIEQITKNDRVVGLERASLQLTGWNKSGTGKKVKGTASRQYEGKIYHISVGEAETNATDNHKFTVRYNKAEAAKYFVYLMKKGERWRVGISQLRNSRGSGMRDRLRGEKADALWIVSQGYENKIDAQVQETIIGLKYRIPQTVWNTGKPGRICAKNDDQISRIYDEIGIQVIDKGARELLGNRINHPQIIRNKGKESTIFGFTVEACNLMPKVYEVLMPHKTATGTIVAQYQQITRIRTEEYQGPVYSLSVEGQHYISDGIVTHNCLYGWKDGAAHYFTTDRTQVTVQREDFDIDKLSKDDMRELLRDILHNIPSTIIEEDKPLRSAEHPTMKPVKLIGRIMKNSTRLTDIVLDNFGGSGTTIIAAEQLGRTCYMMELDPAYCDVIIQRWEELTQESAEYLGNFLEDKNTDQNKE